jgi:hypothetical protein
VTARATETAPITPPTTAALRFGVIGKRGPAEAINKNTNINRIKSHSIIGSILEAVCEDCTVSVLDNSAFSRNQLNQPFHVGFPCVGRNWWVPQCKRKSRVLGSKAKSRNAEELQTIQKKPQFILLNATEFGGNGKTRVTGDPLAGF